MNEYEKLIYRAIHIKEERVISKKQNGFYFALKECPVWYEANLYFGKVSAGRAFALHLALAYFLEHPEKINHFHGTSNKEAKLLFEHFAYKGHEEEVSILKYRFPQLENDFNEIKSMIPKLKKINELFREKERIKEENLSDRTKT